jgi:hypothetical protein
MSRRLRSVEQHTWKSAQMPRLYLSALETQLSHSRQQSLRRCLTHPLAWAHVKDTPGAAMQSSHVPPNRHWPVVCYHAIDRRCCIQALIPSAFANFHVFVTCGKLDAVALCRYGAEAGQPKLRELIASKMYPGGQVKSSEVFVSDGSKCDIGRLQLMFARGLSVAAQVLLLSCSF